MSAERPCRSPGAGDPSLDELFSLTYEELRRLAASVRQDDPRATINPTGLVNEAWLKLARSPPAGALSRAHFKRIAARAMRQVLVEAARRRDAAKRGHGAPALAFDADLQPSEAGPTEMLALDGALAELSRASPRQGAVVEARFFGGLDTRECAEALGVSAATVERDWRAAKAWLAARLRDAP